MRDAILRAAADLFAEHRVEQITFDEVAATAGITAWQLRTYFTSMVGIRDAVAHDERGRGVRASSNGSA